MAAAAAAAAAGKFGSFSYPDGCSYVGDWNEAGQRHGHGQMTLADGAVYQGGFANGFFNGLGVIVFSDGAKYEGEFAQGWFHGHGIFWRSDGMRYEGELRGGRLWGHGLMTYSDGSHGFPRQEGFFQDSRFIQKKKCSKVISRAQKVALLARRQCE
ncbi:MORN repeat-containing protein 4 homolog [Amphibalanus amphitrite]|uniref:MORN repeat-containing protein 4 homolog n=1 Tax=Amphibalanus amphitrite TaxID=1232801 RepID=UPI001C8FE8A8|nr:MORN repeat-containing protein 4 homolog [Amphibalanus amphitrite]